MMCEDVRALIIASVIDMGRAGGAHAPAKLLIHTKKPSTPNKTLQYVLHNTAHVTLYSKVHE